jgi:hypothetical protein
MRCCVVRGLSLRLSRQALSPQDTDRFEGEEVFRVCSSSSSAICAFLSFFSQKGNVGSQKDEVIRSVSELFLMSRGNKTNKPQPSILFMQTTSCRMDRKPNSCSPSFTAQVHDALLMEMSPRSSGTCVLSIACLRSLS